MKLKAAKNSVPGLWCLRYAHMEMLQWRLIRVSLAALGAVVLTIAILGPLGTEARLGFLQRLAFRDPVQRLLLAVLSCPERGHTLRRAYAAPSPDTACVHFRQVVPGRALQRGFFHYSRSVRPAWRCLCSGYPRST